VTQPTYPLERLAAGTQSRPRREGRARRLRRALDRAQRRTGCPDLRLRKRALDRLAEVLLDFAEDVGDEAGLWAAYEARNLEWFGVRLPLAEGTDAGGPDRLRAQIQHLLWTLLPVLVDGDLFLAPEHVHLARLAGAAEPFVREERARGSGPEGSEVRRVLAGPNDHCVDVKQKLVWLGSDSYLFRSMWARYMSEHGQGSARLGAWDDFLCQEATPWSGLGVVELLAAALDLSPEDRESLLAWRLRHTSAYRVLAVEGGRLRLENVAGGREYRVRLEVEGLPFAAGQVVFGSLVPWRGEWYWSGEQRLLGELGEPAVDALRRDLREHASPLVCRSWPEHAERVREIAAELHEAAVARHGDDLVHYPDGLAFAADVQRELREQAAAGRAAAGRAAEGGPDAAPFPFDVPDDVLEHDEGVGVFLHPAEGKGVMLGFTTLLSALRRGGVGLTAVEAATVRAFVAQTTVSPRFVRRLVRDHGAESIRVAFHVRDDPPAYWLDHLLRKYKGHFYRERFPAVGLAVGLAG